MFVHNNDSYTILEFVCDTKKNISTMSSLVGTDT